MYLHPATLEDVAQLPSLKALEGYAADAVAQEEISASPRVGKWQLAVALWQLYERGCEEYDRRVCTGRAQCHEGRAAMPQTGTEQTQVNRNARFQMMKLRRRALKLGVPEELLTRAKLNQERWRWEKWTGRRAEERH